MKKANNCIPQPTVSQTLLITYARALKKLEHIFYLYKINKTNKTICFPKISPWRNKKKKLQASMKLREKASQGLFGI